MSNRRAVAGTFAALLMPTSLLMVTATTTADAAITSSNTSAVQAKSKAKSKAKLVAMPQIVQQGSKPASAGPTSNCSCRWQRRTRSPWMSWWARRTRATPACTCGPSWRGA